MKRSLTSFLHCGYSDRSLRGFTLVEVLVVIAILAVLAGLLLPTLGRMQERSLVVADMNRLKQLGTLLSLFAGDNNGNFPVQGENTTLNFPEALDRYLGEVEGFNPNGQYNFQRRNPVILLSPSARPYPGWNKPAAYPKITGPWAFGFNKYLSVSMNWRGYMARVPNRSKIVIMGCMNAAGGHAMDPDNPPVYEDDVQTRYRASYPGNTSLYMFCDFHIEQIEGDRSMQYFQANPSETNIWRWW